MSRSELRKLTQLCASPARKVAHLKAEQASEPSQPACATIALSLQLGRPALLGLLFGKQLLIGRDLVAGCGIMNARQICAGNAPPPTRLVGATGDGEEHDYRTEGSEQPPPCKDAPGLR